MRVFIAKKLKHNVDQIIAHFGQKDKCSLLKPSTKIKKPFLGAIFWAKVGILLPYTTTDTAVVRPADATRPAELA